MNKFHTIFHSFCTILHFTFQPTMYMGPNFSTFSLVILLVTAILTSMKYYVMMTLLFISLMIRGDEHLVKNQPDICMFSSENCLFKLLTHFKHVFKSLCFLLLKYKILYILDMNPLSDIVCKYFFSLLGCISLCWCFLYFAEVC